MFDTAQEKWSGRWESNPRLKLGKLGYYHYTTPATGDDSRRVPREQANPPFQGRDRPVTQQTTLKQSLDYHSAKVRVFL
jgi:hypothetical protein